MIGIFDNDIKDILGLLDGTPFKRFPFDEKDVLPTQERSDLVLMRDSAYELGGSNLDSLGMAAYDGGKVGRTGGAGVARCGYDNMLAERALKEKTGETSRLKDSYLKQGGII